MVKHDDLFEQLADPTRSPPHGSSSVDRARRAARAVGFDDASRLRWLIRFAENDREADLGSKKVAAEIEAFARRAGNIALNVGAPLTPQAVAELRDTVQAGLRAYVSGATPSFALDFGGLDFALVPGSNIGSWMGPWRSLFVIALGEVVRGQHDRLRTCALPECGQLFFRRKRGLYCSRRCSREQRMRRFRSNLARYKDKRHEYYVQRLARENRLSVKVMEKMVRRRQSEARPSGPRRH